MNKKRRSILMALVAVLVIFVLVVYLVDPLLEYRAPANREIPLLRFIFVVIGLLIAFAVYYATRTNKFGK